MRFDPFVVDAKTQIFPKMYFDIMACKEIALLGMGDFQKFRETVTDDFGLVPYIPLFENI